MENATAMGTNRTGAQMSPRHTGAMQSYAEAQCPVPDYPPQEGEIAHLRSDYVHEAERLGSVPLPGTLTGAFTTGVSKLTGRRPEVLIDKLGERLAFERTGVRLYQAMIDKAEAVEGSETLPFTLLDLRHIRDEELKHMHLVASVLNSLGADPTAQTPAADVAGVAASGVLQVLSDPRTTVPQCLSGLLTAELTDHAGWELLIRLARDAGQDKLLPGFEEAHRREEVHLQKVRGWVSSMVLGEAG